MIFNFQKEDAVYTVPNLLTGVRMALTPVLGYLVSSESYTVACSLFLIAGITDVVCMYM